MTDRADQDDGALPHAESVIRGAIYWFVAAFLMSHSPFRSFKDMVLPLMVSSYSPSGRSPDTSRTR
jgi:hypothetical protein